MTTPSLKRRKQTGRQCRRLPPGRVQRQIHVDRPPRRQPGASCRKQRPSSTEIRLKPFCRRARKDTRCRSSSVRTQRPSLAPCRRCSRTARRRATSPCTLLSRTSSALLPRASSIRPRSVLRTCSHLRSTTASCRASQPHEKACCLSFCDAPFLVLPCFMSVSLPFYVFNISSASAYTWQSVHR